MNDLDRALADLQTIKEQMARSTTFRGFGSEALLLTAAIAVLGGLFQARFVGDGAFGTYVAYWLTIAAVSAGIISVEAVRRACALHPDMAGGILWSGLWQVLPPIFTGGVLAIVLSGAAPDAAWLLPGLWQILIALAVFAAVSALPAGMRLVGGWYLLSGFACIVLSGRDVPPPAAMALPFALGQALGAIVLWRSERVAHHG